MRKHNVRFAQRWARVGGDRTNFPQQMAHSFANSKASHFMCNGLLRSIMAGVGLLKKGNV